MQNRDVGDIGDYVKLSILRALSPGYRLGVAWWLYPDETHNTDGRHISYLQRPDPWWKFHPQLFDALEKIVPSGRRNVRALEAANLLRGAIFAGTPIPVDDPLRESLQKRQQWFNAVQRTLEEADLVFVDPDNGLEPAGYRPGLSKAGKSIMFTELRALATPGRSLILYHHQTRWKTGHHAEIEHWADRLRGCGFATVDALRAKSHSPRIFFLLDAPADIRQRAKQ